MDDNRFAKIAKSGKPNILKSVCKTLVRKLDINVAGEQAHWMKYMFLQEEKHKKRKIESVLVQSS
jgi:hypothetical protein